MARTRDYTPNAIWPYFRLPFALLIAQLILIFAFADNTSAGSARIIIISLY